MTSVLGIYDTINLTFPLMHMKKKFHHPWPSVHKAHTMYGYIGYMATSYRASKLGCKCNYDLPLRDGGLLIIQARSYSSDKTANARLTESTLKVIMPVSNRADGIKFIF